LSLTLHPSLVLIAIQRQSEEFWFSTEARLFFRSQCEFARAEYSKQGSLSGLIISKIAISAQKNNDFINPYFKQKKARLSEPFDIALSKMKTIFS
jgi:hypothetical protein